MLSRCLRTRPEPARSTQARKRVFGFPHGHGGVPGDCDGCHHHVVNREVVARRIHRTVLRVAPRERVLARRDSEAVVVPT